MTIHSFARKLKAKTDAGAYLLLGDELLIKPRWLISKRRIAVRKGNITYGIWDIDEDENEREAFRWLRKNVRFLVDAP